MTKREKMQRAFELLSEAAKLLDQIGGPDAALLSEQVSECANGVGLLMTTDPDGRTRRASARGS